jgi:hypothetical protein
MQAEQMHGGHDDHYYGGIDLPEFNMKDYTGEYINQLYHGPD